VSRRPRVAGALVIVVLIVAVAAPARGQPRPGDDLACPPGTERGRAERGSGTEEWCERPGANPRVLDGPFVSRHSDGAIHTRGDYRDGKPSGTWKSWHANGAPSGEATFVDGKPTGMVLGWYPSGQASFVAGFRDGAPIGSLEVFDPAGRMRSAVDFGPDGTERRRRAWDDANREIDPRSPPARDSEQRALASSQLIPMALTAAGVGR
jgi:hypothetical protein